MKKTIQLNSKHSFTASLQAGDSIEFNCLTLDLLITRLKTIKIKKGGDYKITIEKVSK